MAIATRSHWLKWGLIFVTISLLVLLLSTPKFSERLRLAQPTMVYSYDLTMNFNSMERIASSTTFLPISSSRQHVLVDKIATGGMQFRRQNVMGGQIGIWDQGGGAKKMAYSAQLLLKAVNYQLPSEKMLSTDQTNVNEEYLKETDAIAVNHPEIKALWETIKPEQTLNLRTSLQAIFAYTAGLESLPFKGTTSSLTALRLGAASCNGKSRLFVSLARYLGIPARLVGGIILDGKTKRTSHQWLEVKVDDTWIPFDPSNGHFAALPANYLELYRGDQSLFTHTANIQFNYQFSSTKKLMPMAYLPEATANPLGLMNLAILGDKLNLSQESTISLLMFPFCTLIIAFLRNIVGISTFGIFMPLLVAVSCFNAGLHNALIGGGLMILIAVCLQVILTKLRVLKIPRLAISISMVSLTASAAAYYSHQSGQTLQLISVMPLVVLCFMAETMAQQVSEQDWKKLFITIIGSIISVSACYLLMASSYLQGLLAVFPEVQLLILAALLYIGYWKGIRLSEMLRFHTLITAGEKVIGINERNRDLVYRLNRPKDLALANDKLASKKQLEKFAIPVPKTILQCRHLHDVTQFRNVVSELDSFVLKPNQGSQGNGIIVITRRAGNQWLSPSDHVWSLNDLEQHMTEILTGRFSQHGETDIAYIEPRIIQHTQLTQLAPIGLSDIRIIAANGRIIAGMLRLPTKSSNGKANLHQGAVGCAVELDSGKIISARQNHQWLLQHPESKHKLVGSVLPKWPETLQVAQKVIQAMPLGYLGIDICIDTNQGPLVLEVNGRPGLEIQNIHRSALNRKHIFSGVA